MNKPAVSFYDRKCEAYADTFKAMQDYTASRTQGSENQIWFVEHPPVYTQGQAGKAEHLLLNPQNIPVVQSDRGGQITYHGPGQLVCYFLLNLKDFDIGIRTLVRKLEQAVINLLAQHYQIQAHGRVDAPGVYVGENKICSIGLRVKKYYTYHGIALNIDMDLSPFDFINPCGYIGLKLTQIKDLCAIPTSLEIVKAQLKEILIEQLVGSEVYADQR